MQSFLDLIETALDRAGYRFLRFDGSMTVNEKSSVVEEFKQPSKGPLILREFALTRLYVLMN